MIMQKRLVSIDRKKNFVTMQQIMKYFICYMKSTLLEYFNKIVMQFFLGRHCVVVLYLLKYNLT